VKHIKFLSLLFLVLPVALHAQVARGTVIERGSGAPIHGAFVRLLDAQGRQLAGVLTGLQGEFVFRAPPGKYSLRADRIGHQTANSAPFDLIVGETSTFKLALEVAALRLPEISVRGDQRCVGRPEGSKQTAEVWAEARKALEVAAWVEAGGATFRTRSFERNLDLELQDVTQIQQRFGVSAGKRAYRSAPADSLALRGYVQDRDSTTFLYGPDAELLLSNTFLAQHCFRLERRNDRPGLIGLSFQPISGRRLPDIQGTLWLDEKSAELRFIEYGYTNRDHYLDRRYAGGRTDFERLPNGAWIVRRWYIRGPRLARIADTGEIRVIGTHEEGGEVLDAQIMGDPTVTTLVQRVSIEGIAFDSILGRPLEGARVYLSGTPFTTFAGVAGLFRMDSIPAGTYYIAFSHVRTDSLPSYPPPQRIQADSAVTRVNVATPAVQRLIDLHCPKGFPVMPGAGEDSVPALRGVVYGVVSRPSEPAEGVDVRVAWQRVFSPGGNHVRVRPLALETTTDTDGSYMICGVPVDTPIRVTVLQRNDVIKSDSVRVNFTRFKRHDIRLPPR
jgi:hypothetical protein